VHVLSDEIPLELLGWARPMLSKWSFYRAYLSGFMKSDKTYDLRPGLYGGHRSIVPTGHYRDVVATPDIVPSYLFKAIISGDLERSIELGMLDITEEEAALCSYICPSKTDFDVILRNGLDVYAKEA
jgi:Na+-transporting NADH:ubiquinone oxidoreductase subunit A